MLIIPLNKDAIEHACITAREQSDYMVAIYKQCFPDWDDIYQIEGWPQVNDRTWKAIARMAMDADKRVAPDCMAGGCWMNRGFSSSDPGIKLKDWEAGMEGVVIRLNPKPFGSYTPGVNAEAANAI